MMLQNYAWIKNSFKVQVRPRDINVIEYEKLIDMVSDFTLQLIIKKLPLVEFSKVSKKNIIIILKKLLK